MHAGKLDKVVTTATLFGLAIYFSWFKGDVASYPFLAVATLSMLMPAKESAK